MSFAGIMLELWSHKSCPVLMHSVATQLFILLRVIFKDLFSVLYHSTESWLRYFQAEEMSKMHTVKRCV